MSNEFSLKDDNPSRIIQIRYNTEKGVQQTY